LNKNKNKNKFKGVTQLGTNLSKMALLNKLTGPWEIASQLCFPLGVIPNRWWEERLWEGDSRHEP